MKLRIPNKIFTRSLDGVVITKVPHDLHPSLVIYSNKQWRELSARLLVCSLQSIRSLLAESVRIKMNKDGTIVIPDSIKEYARIKERVIVLPSKTDVNIWAEKEFWKFRKTVMAIELSRIKEFRNLLSFKTTMANLRLNQCPPKVSVSLWGLLKSDHQNFIKANPKLNITKKKKVFDVLLSISILKTCY